ncbi:uncharacterized protein (DUF1810 family) [Novosphingobium sp. PhB165]|uniref:DUF1810 domain-containing protein n=1 Tax=Novosphingobium sp. PhB165 TaxID=2485105 RepID=UPI001047FC6A|nr:DUF1810 domain-containing protein [Novosphingobium sp. PhB165]TCM19008.1 uncharacterized protein (DUF1810 family) [Novosphingobium sp. PhB165]
MADLERFIAAQAAIYPDIVAELENGAKCSHWMWFVFPQIAGLGRSETARRYAIADLAEARAYLAHPVLGARLDECTDTMLGWAGERSAAAILGEIDAMKFRSSMTLFEAAAGPGKTPGNERFARALDAFCAGRRDERTLHLIDRPPAA